MPIPDLTPHELAAALAALNAAYSDLRHIIEQRVQAHDYPAHVTAAHRVFLAAHRVLCEQQLVYSDGRFRVKVVADTDAPSVVC